MAGGSSTTSTTGGISSMTIDWSRAKKYHAGWLHHKNAKTGNWESYWVVLRGNVLFIFDSTNTNMRQTHVGTLSLGKETQIKAVGDSKKGPFKFELVTGSKKNSFKCDKRDERDLWMGFIQGIATGEIPKNLNLLPGHKQSIKDAIHDIANLPPAPPTSGRPPRRPSTTIQPDTMSTRSNDSGSERGSQVGGRSRSSPQQQRNGSIGSRGGAESVASFSTSIPGPFYQKHIFYEDARRTDTPNWFFSACSRERAEMILTAGRMYGDVMMRESTTFRDTGSYVISLRRETSGGAQLTHYEVKRVVEGFKINVEHIHRAMPCLQSVMDYFCEMAGPGTQPLTTNDMDTLGVTGQDNGSGTNTTPRRGRENFNRQGIARGSTRPESFFAPVEDYNDRNDDIPPSFAPDPPLPTGNTFRLQDGSPAPKVGGPGAVWQNHSPVSPIIQRPPSPPSPIEEAPRTPHFASPSPSTGSSNWILKAPTASDSPNRFSSQQPDAPNRSTAQFTPVSFSNATTPHRQNSREAEEEPIYFQTNKRPEGKIGNLLQSLQNEVQTNEQKTRENHQKNIKNFVESVDHNAGARQNPLFAVDEEEYINVPTMNRPTTSYGSQPYGAPPMGYGTAGTGGYPTMMNNNTNGFNYNYTPGADDESYENEENVNMLRDPRGYNEEMYYNGGGRRPPGPPAGGYGGPTAPPPAPPIVEFNHMTLQSESSNGWNSPSSPRPPKPGAIPVSPLGLGTGGVDFETELKRKLGNHFIYGTPSQFGRAGPR